MFHRESEKSIKFTINGTPHTISGDIPADTSLNVYIRDYAKLRGTKAMCHEGGCGACIVAAEIKGKTMAVNSCLVPILICDGWMIYTIEGVGNKRDGYHSIQAALAGKNGSQCGYCSPGMVMNLYSLVQDKKLTMQEIENSFGSNICRCTGYRPILDAFKGFASDASPQLAKDIRDIEEIYKIKTCPKNGMPCKGTCADRHFSDGNTLDIKLADTEFYKVYSIENLFAIFREKPDATYILNGGNTAHGVYRTSKNDLRIDINDIPDLRRVEKTNNSLTLGGGVSLTTAMETFEKYSSETGFKYLHHLAHHIDLIASVPVRNIGSIAGNLMIKHAHNEFPSDLFLMLETASTQIHILEAPGIKKSMMLQDFLQTNMHHKIIYSVVLPALSDDYEYRSYKIMPRAQNAHAHINAGFLFKLDGTGKLLEKPNIIFGGINEHFLHAKNTEQLLMGKSILDKQVLKTALETLHNELQPDHVLPDGSPEFRKTLAMGLFYKFVLSIKPENVNSKLRSGGSILKRDLSSGTQDYDTDKNVWPVNKPMVKLEAIQQTSGEAQYCNDLPPYPGEVFCALVLAKVANGKIDSIDASKALAMKGVVAFFSAKDVPGKNLCISASNRLMMLINDELLFAEKEVLYAGQVIGVIAAETHNLANEAAKLVEVKYSETLKKKPVLTIEDSLVTKDDTRFMKSISIPAKKKGDNVQHKIKGVFLTGSQYHYTMELQSCVCIPAEDGMDVYPTSQWMDLTQISIANVLGVKNNSINVHIRRIGGGYGAKISRNALFSCSCALVCHKLNRPARLIMSIEGNMQAQGKRISSRHEYEIGIDNEGVIQYNDSKYWANAGCNFNDPHAWVLEGICYTVDSWMFNGFDVRTDLPSNTYCRAPGSTEGVAMIENIMEHIAKVIKKDPLQVRLANMNDEDKAVLESMIKDLSKSADYEIRKRAVETFNNENRWKKKGIALVPMKYSFGYWGQFNAMVSVCARDGTVCVTHGGVECGQGINTKVAQVAAYTLGIDVDLVTVKPSNNLITPNNSVTGGSITSEACGYAAIQCCKEILKRLEPVKEELKNPSWQELVLAAYLKDVDLCARHLYAPTQDDTLKPYSIYGATIAEVEIDLLTGQHIIRRVDLMEDVGISLNPEIDVGQVEGAFVMGIGYWTSEELVYDSKTGVLTNDRTWNYKPPGIKDIPEDFRVSFRRNAPNPFGVLRSKVSSDSIPVRMSLLFYIREYVGLRGTKAMCHEGGCGACIVSVKNKGKVIAVNSCLVPVLICHGWNIFTIENLGNKQNGYDKIQAVLADKNGSQCGYCSPGMVMNMYSLMLQNLTISMQQIENSFGGNICRCTGYRAILDAFKGFATDAPPSMVKNIQDIEELYKIKPCRKNRMLCVRSNDKQPSDEKKMLSIKRNARFYRILSIENLFAIFKTIDPSASYTLNGGNTAEGVYRSSIKDIYIDINYIPDLHNIEKTDSALVLGGGVTLTIALQTFQNYSNHIGFKYLSQLAQYVEMIANVPVRNIGTIAGNLMLKYQHKEFPSDLFSFYKKKSLYLWEFLNLDMQHKIIYSVVLPSLDDIKYVCRFYKIMPRAQNAHGHVNAGFLFKLDDNGEVLELPNIIFGGIGTNFLHAKKTEEVLVGKSIMKNLNSTLKEALDTLHGEVYPNHELPDYSPKFRKILAEGLFYKFILNINLNKLHIINPFYISGGTLLERGLSSGQQHYITRENLWPVNEPMPKLESLKQISGEAQYCDDLLPFPKEVFCAFVVTNVGNGKICKIDASLALEQEGVVAFFSAQNIPGKNLCISATSKLMFLPEDELLFAEKDILYAGQPIGVIVAETHNIANEAAKLVEITYSDRMKNPVISIEDALDVGDETRIRQSVTIPTKRKGNDIEYVLQGVFQSGGQYHYSIETQFCVCVPVEGGMDVYPSSQWMDLIQVSIANCLNVQNNSINVHVRRLGGSYGSKISRNAQISCACALVCHELNRPARFIMTMESNMQSIGKRCSAYQEYDIVVNNEGVIQYLKSNQWSNCGSSFNESQAELIAFYMQRSCYLTDTWKFNGFDVRTDLPSNTFCRASGATEAVAIMENMMEHIAKVTKQDPIEVRLANMNDTDKSVLETMIKDLSNLTNYKVNKESIDDFNFHNRWKKKGIAMVPMKYLITYDGQFEAIMSVCAQDGSVCVTHSGIEIDQGINTKIVQIAARILNIDMKLISVKQSNNLATSNKSTTEHSITTESCEYATIQACTQILQRLEPIKKKMKNPTWKDLIFKAHEEGVSLYASYMLMTGPKQDRIKPYAIYGVTSAEVEIDLLTGQHIIRRVDLMIDAGISMNPKIDVGQVEGAFVMGIGYWTSEDLVYAPDTGKLITDRTWNYKPPGAKDIPEDFRVYLCQNSLKTAEDYDLKSIDEAPLCMSYVIPIAFRYALNSARAETRIKEKWYRLDGPCTTERILLTSLTSRDKMVI
ncbi:XDH dehydrogenase, partial [Acromyrmex heyeri]